MALPLRAEMVDFEVRGSGQFPIDMLRYDECWPANDMAVVAMDEGTYRRTVRLRTWRWLNVHPSRWDSFNWTCKILELA